MGPGISSDERDLVMSRFMYSLMISGYDNKYRVELLRGILKKQLDIDTQAREGKRIKYRS